MTGHIYQITNLLNGKIYIGITTQALWRRWSAHKDEAKAGRLDYLIYRAMRKYGIENFIIQSLEEHFAPNKPELSLILNEREKQLILEKGSRDDTIGYNVREGGDSCSGWCHTEETKRKIKETKIRNGTLHAGVAAMVKASADLRRGVPLSAERREQLRLTNLGRKRTEIAREHLRVAQQKHLYTVSNIETGEMFSTTSLLEFCREHSIPKTVLHNSLHHGPRTYGKYTMWKVVQIK